MPAAPIRPAPSHLPARPRTARPTISGLAALAILLLAVPACTRAPPPAPTPPPIVIHDDDPDPALVTLSYVDPTVTLDATLAEDWVLGTLTYQRNHLALTIDQHLTDLQRRQFIDLVTANALPDPTGTPLPGDLAITIIRHDAVTRYVVYPQSSPDYARAPADLRRHSDAVMDRITATVVPALAPIVSPAAAARRF